jgi:dihydroorotate dehydrogenase (fumarate)
MADLSTTYLGLKLRNPIIAASSGLTDSVEKIIDLEKKGIGAVVLKSLFEEEIVMEMEEKMHQMTSRPFYYPETYDYMDEEEKEDTVRKYLRLIKETKASVKIPVIASVNCVSSQKWTYLAKEIEAAGADALELNLFMLPSDFERSSEENEKVYKDIVSEVKKETHLPLSVKISFYSSNLGSKILKLVDTGVKGIVMFNRFYNFDFDIDTFHITSHNVLSSPDDYSKALRWIAIMAERVDVDLAASTGIHNGRTMIKQLLAGAKAVEIASTLYKNGNDQIGKMLTDLEDWMKRNNFKNLDDFVGKMSQSKNANPAAFERVQFMKHFSQFIFQ